MPPLESPHFQINHPQEEKSPHHSSHLVKIQPFSQCKSPLCIVIALHLGRGTWNQQLHRPIQRRTVTLHCVCVYGIIQPWLYQIIYMNMIMLSLQGAECSLFRFPNGQRHPWWATEISRTSWDDNIVFRLLSIKSHVHTPHKAHV